MKIYETTKINLIIAVNFNTLVLIQYLICVRLKNF